MVRATYSFRKEMHNRLQMTLLSIYMFTQKLYIHLNVHGFFFVNPCKAPPIINLGATSCIFRNCCPPCNFSHFSSHDFCNCSLSFRTKSCLNAIVLFKLTLELSPKSDELFGLSFLFEGFTHSIPHRLFPAILWARVCYVILESQKTLTLCLLMPEASIYFEISFSAS